MIDPMVTLLENVALVAVGLFDIVVDTAVLITAQPLLLAFFSIAVVGSGVSLFQRLRG